MTRVTVSLARAGPALAGEMGLHGVVAGSLAVQCGWGGALWTAPPAPAAPPMPPLPLPHKAPRPLPELAPQVGTPPSPPQCIPLWLGSSDFLGCGHDLYPNPPYPAPPSPRCAILGSLEYAASP